MRTYVFGAGASVHAGYPLASKLWPFLEKWVGERRSTDQDCGSIVDQINEYFDSSKPFELILSDLDDRIEGTSDRFERVILSTLRGQLQLLICRYFDSIRTGPAELYRLFAQDVLRPQDAVITFNYDVSLDRELNLASKWHAADGYGFVLDQAAKKCPSCKLLKLHGSTNWIAQIFGGLQGVGAIDLGEPSLGRRPVIPTPELEYLDARSVDPRFVMGTGYVPSLIMPVAKKKFFMETSFGREWEDFWDSLWVQAEQAVAASDEIFIIGHSLPEYDERARKLLLETVRQDADVTVCCRSGTEALVRLFESRSFKNSHPGADGTFENWLYFQQQRFRSVPQSA
jgi:hypothetical protein